MYINSTWDLIDSRKILERIEELEKQKGNRWTAGWNMPGYMPDSEPATFEDFEDAKNYTVGAIQHAADMEEDAEQAEAMEQCAEYLSKREDGEFSSTVGEYCYWITKGGELDEDDAEELEQLKALAQEVEAHTGPEYYKQGVMLIAEGYFEQYAQEMAEGIGAIEGIDVWPATCIDWEKATDAMKQDYSSIGFDGEIYWVRG